MPNFCAAPNCTRKSTQSDLAFFRFPRDPERCRIWVENCRRADLEAKTADQLNKHYRLCAKHFDPGMVCKTSPYRTVLKDTAIPTIFDLTSHLKNPHTRHRKRIKELTEDDIQRMKERQLAAELSSKVEEESTNTADDEPQLSAEEKEYREYLRSLFEILLLLGKQGIPLTVNKASETEFKPNNFQALLDYSMNAGDAALRKRFSTTAVNTEYLSSAQLNQLLEVCENTVREEMLMEVRESRFFSLVTGELVEFSKEKYLPLFLRYVNQQNLTREELLDFLPFGDGDECALVERLEAQLTERWGLSMEDCRGQAHKASGTSTIKMKAVAVLLMEKYKFAVHVPCSYMPLNIHLANNLPYPNVQVTMETLRRIAKLFEAPSTQSELEKAIDVHHQKSEDKASALKEACASRWTEQHNVFDVLLDVLPPLLLCMDNIRENDDGLFTAPIVASAYFSEILADFEFIVTIVILKNVLTFSRAFGRNLQGETLDVFAAANSLTAVLHSLNEVNDNIDVYHEFWYEEAISLASLMEIPVSIPRLFLRKQRSIDAGEIQAELYFKEYVTVPVIRGIMQEVEDMFSDTHLNALKCLSLVPAVMGQMKFNTMEENYADIYHSDLPSPDTLPAELHCWRIKWKHRGKEVRLPTSIHETLQLPDVKFFPNVNSFLKVLSTLPVLKLESDGSSGGDNDTASKRLQAYFDNTPVKNWHRSLAMLHVNSHVKHDLDVMVDKYCRLYPEDEVEPEEPMEEEAATN
ncbi:THAP domain containing 12b [Oryzias melastigma]|uniref:THAP domain containing 12b n=1 Tax=Oryzias melastigma TaxID=30732 RepID=A0A3B3D7H1_ORYME|nr:THAP domain containing 12b [Oryzias melastigma]